MKTNIVAIAFVLSMAAGEALAGPVLVLNPSSGVLAGQPGETIGWGFTATADPVLWTSFVASFTILESDPAVGIYTDFIGLQGGPVNFVFGPAAPNWIQSFDNNLQTGIGSFTIDPGAAVGSFDGGILHVDYQSFSADPNQCSSCFAGSGGFDLPFGVNVVPEPGTWMLAGGTLLALLAGSRRRRSQ